MGCPPSSSWLLLVLFFQRSGVMLFRKKARRTCRLRILFYSRSLRVLPWCTNFSKSLREFINFMESPLSVGSSTCWQHCCTCFLFFVCNYFWEHTCHRLLVYSLVHSYEHFHHSCLLKEEWGNVLRMMCSCCVARRIEVKLFRADCKCENGLYPSNPPDLCISNLLIVTSQCARLLCLDFNTLDASGSLLIKRPWAWPKQGPGSSHPLWSQRFSFWPVLFRF